MDSFQYDIYLFLPGFERCYEAVTVTFLLKLDKGFKIICATHLIVFWERM